MPERRAGLPSFDLSGQTALITGAAGLMGVEHAAALAEIGARVVLSDVDMERLQRSAARLEGGNFTIVAMDVTREASILQAAAEIGIVDILVNNAAVDAKVSTEGVGDARSRLENFSLESWNHEIAVGLTGAFLCAKIFGAAMSERRHGVILNIASDLSVIAPDQRLYRKPGLDDHLQPVKPVTYSVIKTGLIGLTRYLAGYWADRNVRVNALSPGGVFNNQSEIFVERLTRLVPLGRMADIDEYRAAVQFLCSPASSYMTGQNMVLDGGRSVL